ncbi:MAG: hypothetical protein ABWX60_06000 [Aeromicrobium sp.]
MATPERRTASGTPAVHSGTPVASGPVPVMSPLGWLLILGSGATLILGSWLLYGTESVGMWAGYHDGIIGTVVVLAGMGLNTSLPKQPLLGICGLAGILLILFAVFFDYPTHVVVIEMVAGIGLLLGVGLYASGRRD